MFGASNQSPFGQSTGGGGFGGTGGFGSPAPAPSGGLFGSPTPAFGAPAPAFGAPAPAFGGGGTSVFGGSPAPAPAFGGSTFSAPAPSSGLFGAPAPAFGAPAPSGGLFGAPAPSASPFGASAPAAPSLFGAPAPSPFGAPAPTFGSTFGSPQPAPAPLFGAPQPAPAFGSTFGAPSSSPFGATAPAPPAFGATPAPSAFGAAAPSPGLFGGMQAGGGQTGTTHTPFQAVSKQDGSSSINVQSITGMSQYEQKSFEELRFEDYQQGNKGTASTGMAPTAATSTFGGFGAPAPTPGLFGSTPAPAPSTGFGGFGSSPAPSTSFGAFGSTPAPATAFGAPAPSGGGLFGASSPTPAPSGFGFGSTPAPAPSGGLFGSAPAPSTGFGGFGSPVPAPSGGLFGSAPAPAFGAPAPSGAFGAPAPSGGLFGTQSAPAPSAGVGAFGSAPAPSSGGLFGTTPAPSAGFGFNSPAPAPGGGLFGSTPTPAPAFGGFGAAPQPAPGGLFSPAPAQPQQSLVSGPILPANASIIQPAQSEMFEQQMRALNSAKEDLASKEVWGESSAKSKVSVTPKGNTSGTSFFSPGYSPMQLSTPYRVSSPPSAVAIKPRGFPKTESTKSRTPKLALASNGRSSYFSNSGPLQTETHLSAQDMKIFIKPESLSSKKAILKLPTTETLAATNQGNETSNATPTGSRGPKANGTSPSTPMTPPQVFSPTEQSTTTSTTIHTGLPPKSPRGQDYYDRVVGSVSATPSPQNAPTPKTKVNPLVPVLSKEGYSMTPSKAELESMSDGDLAAVRHFSVARPGYGKIEWEGCVDVRGANINRAVVIERGDISVYALEEEDGTKPEEGSKLNRPARLTFYDIYPKEGVAASDSMKAAFAVKIEKKTKKMEAAQFVSYDMHSGTWVIRVEHFSRYRLDSEDSDDENEQMDTSEVFSSPLNDAKGVTFDDGTSFLTKGTTRHATPYQPAQKMRFSDDTITEGDFSPLRRQATPFKSRITAPIIDDISESYDEEDGFHDATMDDVEDILHKGENAFTHLSSLVNESSAVVVPDEASDDQMPVCRIERAVELVIPNTDEAAADFFSRVATKKGKLCRRLAQKHGVFRGSVVDKSLCGGMGFHGALTDSGRYFSIDNTCVPPKIIDMRINLNSPLLQLSLDLLRVLQKHAVACNRDDVDPALVRLPQMFDMSRSDDEHKSLLLLLDHLQNTNGLSEDIKMTLGLISILADTCDPADHMARKIGVLRWIKKACSSTVNSIAASSRANDDPSNAIFAAFASGDIQRASDLAKEANMLPLGILLSTSPEAHRDIARYITTLIEDRHILLKNTSMIQCLEACAQTARGDKLDWRFRLGLLIAQSSPSEQLSDIVSKLGPDFLSRNANQVENPYAASILASLVDPGLFATRMKDDCVSFIITSLVSASNLIEVTDIQFQRISNMFIAQLIRSGFWEWAVVVCLHTTSYSPAVSCSKLRMARMIIMQNVQHMSPDPASVAYKFAEEYMRLPTKWFAQASTIKTAYDDLLDQIPAVAAHWNKNERDAATERLLPRVYFAHVAMDTKPDSDSLHGVIAKFISARESACLWLDKNTDDVVAGFNVVTSLEDVECALKGQLARPELECSIHLPKPDRTVSKTMMIRDALTETRKLCLKILGCLPAPSIDN